MFGSIQPTQFDLVFRFGPIPCRVNPFFWVIGIVFGWQAGTQLGPEFLLIWLLVLFVSILVHELGHAFMARWFGYDPHVILYHFGGLAIYQPDSRHTTGKSIAISFAGPGAGFILYGIVRGVRELLVSQQLINDHSAFAILQLEWINLWWGLVNLLPVLPLDGGRISEALFTQYMGRRGIDYCLKLGIIVAVGVALFAFLQLRSQYIGFMFAILAAINIQMMQQYQRGGGGGYY